MKTFIKTALKFLMVAIVCCTFIGEVHAVEVQPIEGEYERYCSSCEHPVEEEDNFCSYCGEQIDVQEIEQKEESKKMEIAVLIMLVVLCVLALLVNLVTNKRKKNSIQ